LKEAVAKVPELKRVEEHQMMMSDQEAAGAKRKLKAKEKRLEQVESESEE
jgi:hypothetical protein